MENYCFWLLKSCLIQWIVYLFRNKFPRTPDCGIHITDLNLLKYKYRHADKDRVARKHLLCCYVIPVSMKKKSQKRERE